MLPRFPKLITYLSLLLLGGVFLGPLVTYATLTLDSTSLTSDSTLTLKSASSSVTNIGETNQTGAITVASSSETLTLNLGTGTGAATVNMATGATNAKTVNIATGASLLNTITLGAASTTLSVAASSTFGSSLGLSSLTTNSLIYTNSSGVVTALASSTAGKILTASGTAPYFSWETTGSLTNLTLTGPSTNSPIYLNSAGLITALASSTAGKVLMATGTAPYFSWETSSGGITSLGGLTGATQTFASSTGISISSAGTAHTIGVATSTAFTWTGAHTFQASTTLSNLANNGLLYVDAAKNIERLASSTAGNVLTATSSTPPYFAWASSNRTLTYNEFTSYVENVTATTEATANTVVTADAYTFDGTTPVLIEMWVPFYDNTTAGNIPRFVLYDGSSSIGILSSVHEPANGYFIHGGYMVRRLTPSAASHTYSLRIYVNAGTTRVYCQAGGVGQFMPCFIKITKDN